MKFIWRNEEEILHYIMTFMGGFMGLYAICAYGNYGSAQTGNLMTMITDFVGRDIYDFTVRLGGFIVFSLGIAISWLFTRFCKLPMRELCVLADAAALALSASLSKQIYPFFHLYPLFLATSFQWGTFDGVGKYRSASLFLTGNLKSCIISWLEYFVDHKTEVIPKARIYTMTILSYLAGGFAGCLAVAGSGRMGAFFGYLPLAAAGMILAGEHIRTGRKLTKTV